jgi:hypothetical protein
MFYMGYIPDPDMLYAIVQKKLRFWENSKIHQKVIGQIRGLNLELGYAQLKNNHI